MATCIIILCMVGSFSLRNNVFNVWTAFGFGVAGYLLQKVKLPVAPDDSSGSRAQPRNRYPLRWGTGRSTVSVSVLQFHWA